MLPAAFRGTLPGRARLSLQHIRLDATRERVLLPVQVVTRSRTLRAGSSRLSPLSQFAAFGPGRWSAERLRARGANPTGVLREVLAASVPHREPDASQQRTNA